MGQLKRLRMRGIYILGGVRKVRMRFNSTLLNHQATEVRAQEVSFRSMVSFGCATNTRGPDNIILSLGRVIIKAMIETEIILLIVTRAASC